MTRTLLLFGAGPGIGNVRPFLPNPPPSIPPNKPQHVAAAFASAGINHIILLARNISRLQTSDAPFVTSHSSGVKVSTLCVDLADLATLPDVLSKLDTLTAGEDVEVVYFNAARIVPNEPLGVDVKEIEEDLKVSVSFPFL